MNVVAPLLILLPLAALLHAMWRSRADPSSTAQFFRKAFLSGGVALLLLALVGLTRWSIGRYFYFGLEPGKIDTALKAGIGMMLGALVCAVVEHGRAGAGK
ncbi:hypothetical protein AB0B45_05235 [Nonomuraea sp. NPDC049152]|uniref:hypothetical protein n=1 Tax=Nonomuraea sp. NPDC049152 TaxID=3154350 RepID=UPI0033C0DCFD